MADKCNTRPIPLEKARSALRYDPETGHLYWLVKRGRQAAGSMAGCVKNDRGYVAVRLYGVIYYAHRVAWVLHTGEQIPDGMEIDHRNGIPSDNRLANLRLATMQQNKQNMAPSDMNTSGHVGVTYRKSRRKWQAQISVENGCRYLGSFDRIEDAIAAREAAEREIFGEFAYRERNAA